MSLRILLPALVSALVVSPMASAASSTSKSSTTLKGHSKAKTPPKKQEAEEEKRRLEEEERARKEFAQRQEEEQQAALAREAEGRAAAPTPASSPAETEGRAVTSGQSDETTKVLDGWTLALAGFYYADNGKLVGRERRSIRILDTNLDVENADSLGLSFEAFKPAKSNLRWGIGLRYFFDYLYQEKPEGEDDEPEPVLLGQLLELNGRLDLLVPLKGKLRLHLGVHAGPCIVFPDGQLREDIRANSAQGIGVWDVPRLGIQAGPQLGATYRLLPNLGVRAEFALSWQRQFLFSTEDDVAGVEVEVSRHLAVRRGALSLGLELAP